MRIQDYAELFALDGAWRIKRAEKRRVYTDKSMRTRHAVMQNWIIPLWGGADPRRLTVKAVDDAMTGIASKLTGRPLAGTTRNRILSVLSELYQYLMSQGLARYNIVRDVTLCPQRPERPRSALSLAEMRALFPRDQEERLRIWRTRRYLCAFLILRDTGLRPGELAALRWRDWDPEIKFFPILAVVESGTRDRIKGTKTGAAKPAIITDETAGR